MSDASAAAALEGLDGIRASIEELYRDLHRHPELSHAEHRTAGIVLDPLRPSGDRRVQRRVFDHLTDSAVDTPVEVLPVEAVVIVEGMFLHRDELVSVWDWSVFLDVPFAETARRLARRDGSHPDPDHPTMRRYVEGQRRAGQARTASAAPSGASCRPPAPGRRPGRGRSSRGLPR